MVDESLMFDEKKYKHEYYEKHKDKIKQRSKEWDEKQTTCQYERRKKYFRKYEKDHKDIRNKYRVEKLYHKKRLEIVELLGGKCANPNCPIPPEKMDKRMLQIDHINGGGNEEHKKFGPYKFLRIVLEKVKAGSRDYQLLCVYCNWLKRYEKKEFN